MSEAIIGVSGHRPKGLGSGHTDTSFSMYLTARTHLESVRVDKVIVGMALGFDQAVACAALDLGLPIIAAVPFKGQELLWSKPQQAAYNKILDSASEVVYVGSPGYSDVKMLARNKWIVDHSTKMVFLYDGRTNGGTYKCMNYTVHKKVPYVNLWNVFLSTLQ